MGRLFLTLLLLAGCTSYSALERRVVERAYSEPATAPEYFMHQIESGATVYEQAVYMYGTGLAHEKLGNKAEAFDDYLSAEALGYDKAAKALQRFKVK